MKRALSVILALIMILALAAGCGSATTTAAPGGTTKAGTTTASTAPTTTEKKPDIWAAYKDTVTITIGRNGSAPVFSLKEDTIENNAYIRFIKEKYNIQVKYAFYTAEEYNTKVALTITSGNLPDLMFVTAEDQIKSLIESDMVENLTKYVKNYSSDLVNDIVESYGGMAEAYKNVTVNGEIRALRCFSPGYQYNLTWLRKDWLDKVGAKAPATLDELEAVAKKFVDAQLGGKGTTVGFEIANNVVGNGYNTGGFATPVFSAYKAYPKEWYADKNGELIYGSLTNETKQALGVLAKWYKAGLIDKEFVSKDFNASIGAGYSGITFVSWSAGSGGMTNCMTNDPNAVWISIPNIMSAEGTYNVTSPDTETVWAVVRKGYAHPEIAIMLMNLNADVTTLAREPITNFKTARTTELIAIDSYPPGKWMYWPYAMETQYYDAQIRLSTALVKAVEGGDTTGWPASMAAQVEQARAYKNGTAKDVTSWGQYNRYLAKSYMVAAESKTKILDCYFPSTTDTMKLLWSDLQTLETTTFQKIVMGELSLDSFDSFVSNWKSKGGADIIKEVNAQYKSLNKK